ncbi:cation acetate symporter [Desulforamulus hydrothermalis]|uniref:Na+/solute symporter n=1 Tax=Desulforamulus hydrothermalis Lam5 = DSM 18033 TaxID=1121428 RepID=K8EI46_9FIRM|nr:cation acetate symporter [Desulforamulus hydrothermalis]CCO08291.1 Na+/solute symporter [Desulforamulus hydrothermalis Lam5 = DSM 18033]SHH37862.1 Sodium:solute symporter family protein [Desulforamulus hydrothermalis Lam5 = DSM 18033]
MSGIAWIPLICVTLLVIGTIGLGFYVQRSVRSTSDLYVASRAVGVSMNSAAISGEYLSAASFMGVAGMVMKYGYDVLWYPALYAAGYLFLLLFIAGPLRRFGAYTIPDFAEGRFDSPAFRKIAVAFVLVIGLFYTMPQMKGAGVALVNILHTPYWVGVILVGTVITFNVALGGMKGITFVQAFQYWVKMFAISLPIFILFSVVGGYAGQMQKIDNGADAGRALPTFKEDTTVIYKPAAPANEIIFPAGVTATFVNGAEVAVATAGRGAAAGGSLPAAGLITGLPDRKVTREVGGQSLTLYCFAAGSSFTVSGPVETDLTGADGKPRRVPVKLTVFPATGQEYVQIAYGKGEIVPNAPTDKAWLEPFGPFTNKYGHPLLYTYSLIIAIICGTAGLPHILVRFYTNPDGRAAKRTAFWVIILLGCFYFFPPIWGVLGRNLVPHLYAVTGGAFSTDAVVLMLPRLLNDKLPYLGDLLSGITSAGAFAGFMTTFSGLLVSITGALAHDIYGNMLNPQASPDQRLKAFRIAAVMGGLTAMALGTLVENFDINMMVGWAFAIAAASYFPLLIVSVWWRGTSATGAAVGMLGGGITALAAIVSVMLADKKVIPALAAFYAQHPVLRSLAEQPAIWAVPLSLSLIFIISFMTPGSVPKDAGCKMLVLHAPEELGLRDEYIKEGSGQISVSVR